MSCILYICIRGNVFVKCALKKRDPFDTTDRFAMILGQKRGTPSVYIYFPTSPFCHQKNSGTFHPKSCLNPHLLSRPDQCSPIHSDEKLS